MQELLGHSDLTLCQYLMTQQSNSEIAMIIAQNMKRDASDAKVAEFTKEFINRKAEAENAAVKKGNARRQRKKQAKQA